MGERQSKTAPRHWCRLIFKGSGFYITDYRSESYKTAAKKETSSGSEKGGGESQPAKTENKPAPGTAPAKKSEPKTKKDT